MKRTRARMIGRSRSLSSTRLRRRRYGARVAASGVGASRAFGAYAVAFTERGGHAREIAEGEARAGRKFLIACGAMARSRRWRTEFSLRSGRELGLLPSGTAATSAHLARAAPRRRRGGRAPHGRTVESTRARRITEPAGRVSRATSSTCLCGWAASDPPRQAGGWMASTALRTRSAARRVRLGGRRASLLLERRPRGQSRRRARSATRDHELLRRQARYSAAHEDRARRETNDGRFDVVAAALSTRTPSSPTPTSSTRHAPRMARVGTRSPRGSRFARPCGENPARS